MSSAGVYHTLRSASKSQIEIKGSRFLALAFPVTSESEIKTILQSLQKENYDATHICYAYRTGVGKSEKSKAFDAGEPNFTAGKPILNAILSQDLADVLVAVVRWFGGTKLGKGNLAKAYREAAQRVLSLSEKIEKFVTQEMEFEIEVDKFNSVQSILNKFKVEIVEKRFDKECKIRARVPQVNLSHLKEKLVEATSGKIKFK